MQAPKVEQIADLPLLSSVIDSSNMVDHLDAHIATHGNWSGPSIGKITKAWLLFILSRSDHRLSYVEDWAKSRIFTLRNLLSSPFLNSSDFTDDHLGIVLDYLSDDSNWNHFEASHTKEFLQVYHLTETENLTVRLDSFISQGFRPEGELFKKGYSKQHRKDLPQVKTMVASIDPLSLPVANEIVSGNRADDVLYQPVIKKVQANIQSEGLLYVGDSKMSSTFNRSYLHWSKNIYLCPLTKIQCSDKELLKYLSAHSGKLIKIKNSVTSELLSEAFEVYELIEDAQGRSWRERRVIARSCTYAKSQIENFDAKIIKTKELLDKLFEKKSGREHPKTSTQAEEMVNQVLEKQGLSNFFDYSIKTNKEKRTVNAYRDKPKRVETKTWYQLKYQTKDKEIENHKDLLGWRVYVTNAKKNKLTTKQVIECYRAEYKIEHLFNKLLNKVTVLVPIFLQKDNRVKGLIRLLLLAMKFDCIIQEQIREKLSKTEQEIKELYPGNPGRKTNKPTTQLILNAFKEISLVIFKTPDGNAMAKLTALSEIQVAIIQLLGLNKSIYLDLENISFFKSKIVET